MTFHTSAHRRFRQVRSDRISSRYPFLSKSTDVFVIVHSCIKKEESVCSPQSSQSSPSIELDIWVIASISRCRSISSSEDGEAVSCSLREQLVILLVLLGGVGQKRLCIRTFSLVLSDKNVYVVRRFSEMLSDKNVKSVGDGICSGIRFVREHQHFCRTAYQV